jgi:arylformamidase
LEIPGVDAALPISGIFDVEPCRLNYLNEKLGLSETEASAMSPIKRLARTSGRLVIAYGTAELPELQRQSQEFAQARQAAGLPATLLSLEGYDHFSILEELATPGGRLVAALSAL